ncbi:MAG: 4-amino-4-deoxy-L-arabinose transferase [Microbacterium sp. SCN 70-200]|uniref:YrdB family protein n=1 Tax=unclassified Microbacterium TaxID=2609290 RepID=UPI00086C6A7C|nr:MULTISPECIES: YrdB family protein [unclassified Microbacterium]MBN9215803.1 YrdB family protein [Microbacterium sp.]ODT39917.1 MAG: 4-amino-4-deoxy-L-arabinose transferase [Microbacterium sp. SCN 70-200]OJV81940.1 MAG: 4-amino-4-deoxy-L-arabinose transferase [Microbacterium sp. 70-16]
MADLPPVRPSAPEQPAPLPASLPAGTRPALDAVDVLAFLCELFAFATLAVWGFTAWPFPWNIVAGIGAPLIAILLWALFVSPRAVIRVHPFVRALVELLVYASATIVWWTSGSAWIGLGFAVVAVAVGLVAGRRRLA